MERYKEKERKRLEREEKREERERKAELMKEKKDILYWFKKMDYIIKNEIDFEKVLEDKTKKNRMIDTLKKCVTDLEYIK